MYFSNFLQYHFKSLLQPSVFQDFPARSWANCIQTCQRCTLGCFLSLPSPPSHFSSYFPPQTSKTCYEKLSSAVLEHRSRKKSCGDWGLRGRSRPGPSGPCRPRGRQVAPQHRHRLQAARRGRAVPAPKGEGGEQKGTGEASPGHQGCETERKPLLLVAAAWRAGCRLGLGFNKLILGTGEEGMVESS